jgi:nucleotide-binding universal stress UspA family protein
MKELTPQEQELSETKVITGSLFEDMGKAAHLLSASLIVMGTHGAHGMQKVFGSNAVKMISNTSAPLLITQGKKTVEKIKNIVMPFSFAKESIQISTFAGSIAQKFNATIHLVGFHDKDEWLEGHTRTNQKIVRQLLTDNNIKHEIVNLSKKESYEKELMDYSASVDADLIAAAYFKEGIMPSPNSFIQIIIENELQIPLLTVNSEELSVTSGMSFMTV